MPSSVRDIPVFPEQFLKSGLELIKTTNYINSILSLKIQEQRQYRWLHSFRWETFPFTDASTLAYGAPPRTTPGPTPRMGSWPGPRRERRRRRRRMMRPTPWWGKGSWPSLPLYLCLSISISLLPLPLFVIMRCKDFFLCKWQTKLWSFHKCAQYCPGLSHYCPRWTKINRNLFIFIQILTV